MPATKSDDKKSMDVSKPGKATPDTSGRPVIVTHRPMVVDPMVKSEDPLVGGTEKITEAPANAQHASKTIQPVSDDSKAAKPTETVAADEPSKTEAITKPDEASVTPEASKPEADKPSEQTENTDAAIVDAVIDQAAIDKKKDGELTEEEKKKHEALQKLIEDKKYFVPVGQVAKRRNQRAGIVVLVLILLAAGTYLALDAGILDIGFKLPIDLIKN